MILSMPIVKLETLTDNNHFHNQEKISTFICVPSPSARHYWKGKRRQLSLGQDVKAGAAAGDTKDSWDAGLGDTWGG